MDGEYPAAAVAYIKTSAGLLSALLDRGCRHVAVQISLDAYYSWLNADKS
jgi:hypothetical protein